MRRKKEGSKPRKVLVTLEIEEKETRCCECLFGATCPYACALARKLDCARYDLATLELKSIEPIEQT